MKTWMWMALAGVVLLVVIGFAYTMNKKANESVQMNQGQVPQVTTNVWELLAGVTGVLDQAVTTNDNNNG